MYQNDCEMEGILMRSNALGREGVRYQAPLQHDKSLVGCLVPIILVKYHKNKLIRYDISTKLVY